MPLPCCLEVGACKHPLVITVVTWIASTTWVLQPNEDLKNGALPLKILKLCISGKVLSFSYPMRTIWSPHDQASSQTPSSFSVVHGNLPPIEYSMTWQGVPQWQGRVTMRTLWAPTLWHCHVAMVDVPVGFMYRVRVNVHLLQVHVAVRIKQAVAPSIIWPIDSSVFCLARLYSGSTF
jgi:hypothetical protein